MAKSGFYSADHSFWVLLLEQNMKSDCSLVCTLCMKSF